MTTRDIMVIDDQPSVCREVAAFLKDVYTVHAFTTGKEALAYLSENQVDLILLDYEMPGMTGYEVLMSIRLSKHTSDIPVIFLTGETNERMRQEMIGRGANDYLCKPTTSSDLRLCIERNIRA